MCIHFTIGQPRQGHSRGLKPDATVTRHTACRGYTAWHAEVRRQRLDGRGYMAKVTRHGVQRLCERFNTSRTHAHNPCRRTSLFVTFQATSHARALRMRQVWWTTCILRTRRTWRTHRSTSLHVRQATRTTVAILLLLQSQPRRKPALFATVAGLRATAAPTLASFEHAPLATGTGIHTHSVLAGSRQTGRVPGTGYPGRLQQAEDQQERSPGLLPGALQPHY